MKWDSPGSHILVNTPCVVLKPPDCPHRSVWVITGSVTAQRCYMPRRGWPDSQQPMDRGLMSLLGHQRSAVVGPLAVTFGPGPLSLAAAVLWHIYQYHHVQQANNILILHRGKMYCSQLVAHLTCHNSPAEGASAHILQLFDNHCNTPPLSKLNSNSESCEGFNHLLKGSSTNQLHSWQEMLNSTHMMSQPLCCSHQHQQPKWVRTKTKWLQMLLLHKRCKMTLSTVSTASCPQGMWRLYVQVF